MLDIDINVKPYGRLMTQSTLSHEAAPAAVFPWRFAIVLAAGTLWTVTAELLPAGLLLEMGADLSVPPPTVGYIVSAWGVTIALVSLPLTRLTRRMDRRSLLVASLALTGVATLLTAVAPTYPLLVATRVIAAAAHGLFWSQVVVVGSGLVAPAHAARAVAVIVAGPTVASIAAIPAATMLGQVAGWRPAFAAVALLTVVTAVGLRLTLPRIAPLVGAPRDGQRDRSVGRVVTAAALGAVLLVAHFAVFTLVAPVLTRPGALDRTDLGLALFVFGAAGAAGLLVAPMVMRRAPSWGMPLAGGALAVSLGALVVTTGTVPLLGVVAAWGLVIGAFPVIFQTRLLTLASDDFRPTAGAVVVVAFNLGIAAGATLGSALAGALGPASLAAPAGLLAAGAAVALAISRGTRAG